MSGRPQRGRLLGACALAALLAACAQPPRSAANAGANYWSGRLAVTVDGESAKSFQAGFELTGTPDAGTLTLFNPLGNAMARLTWQPQGASLRQGEQVRTSASLTMLITELTGSTLPVAALFGWLHGQAIAASGWSADLSHLPQGRIVATRAAPEPHTTLRIVLD